MLTGPADTINATAEISAFATSSDVVTDEIVPSLKSKTEVVVSSPIEFDKKWAAAKVTFSKGE